MAGNLFSKDSMQAWSVGIHFVLSTFVGLGIGYWLDGFFKTSPWLTLIFLFLGIISGFRELYKIAKKQARDTDQQDL